MKMNLNESNKIEMYSKISKNRGEINVIIMGYLKKGIVLKLE